MAELRFDGKVAFVTGGSAGIGKAYCLMLARRGATVVVNGNYRPSGVGPEMDVVAEIKASGGKALGANGSVTDDAAVRRMIAETIAEFGSLDIVVNNAGTASNHTPVQEGPGPDLEEQLDVHLRGTMQIMRAAWPHLVASGEARIINVGSGGAFGYIGPWGWEGTYSIAKSALFAATRQMGGAGEEFGMKVNLVLPWGYTKMLKSSLDGTEIATWMETKCDPMKVAAATLYLLHKDCPVNSDFFSTGAGRIAHITFASTRGYYNSEISPEDTVDNWDAIYGHTDEEGHLEKMFAIPGFAREWEEYKNTIV